MHIGAVTGGISDGAASITQRNLVPFGTHEKFYNLESSKQSSSLSGKGAKNELTWS